MTIFLSPLLFHIQAHLTLLARTCKIFCTDIFLKSARKCYRLFAQTKNQFFFCPFTGFLANYIVGSLKKEIFHYRAHFKLKKPMCNNFWLNIATLHALYRNKLNTVAIVNVCAGSSHQVFRELTWTHQKYGFIISSTLSSDPRVSLFNIASGHIEHARWCTRIKNVPWISV